VRTLTILEPVELPQGLVLFVERGCWSCDGPADSIERFYTDSAGALRRDLLFEAPTGSIFGGPVFGDDGAVYMSTCSRGYCGYLGAPSGDAQSTVFRSLDGGITWEDLGNIAGPAAVAFVAGRELILDRSTFDADGSSEWHRRYVRFPSGDELVAPPGYEGRFVTAMWLNQQILWFDLESAVVVDGTGAVVYDLGAITGLDASTHRMLISAFGGDLVLLSYRKAGGDEALHHVMHAGEVGAVLRMPGQSSFGLASPMVHSSRALGNLWISVGALRLAFEASGSGASFLDDAVPGADQKSLPAVLDLWAATAQPLKLFGPTLGENYTGNRNFIVHADEGAFFRVETGDDDCLNVREEPSVDAPVVACYASGVLLADLREQVEPGGSWRKVATPLGIAGWASEAYLER
jgi:hypothetical protein